ncbi:MAG TPA: cytochrome C oxidase subunit IV family protein [Thermomicrobiaceae bacterium]|nr:cytochrome C oxidase subunit IV family protein [Thermomicrobiaceae bacterium]
MSHQPGESVIDHAHPGASTYIKLAVVLGIITMAEVITYYLTGLSVYLIVTALIILSALKFIFVVSYYMHLKYDARLLTGIFVWGLFVATSIILAMMLLYHAYL